MKETAIDLSPTAEATRLMLPGPHLQRQKRLASSHIFGLRLLSFCGKLIRKNRSGLQTLMLMRQFACERRRRNAMSLQMIPLSIPKHSLALGVPYCWRKRAFIV